MFRVLPVMVLAVLVGCTGFGVEKISGDENQVVLSSADQEKARQHCASFGRDAVNLGKTPEGNIAYACRPRASGS